MNTKLKPGVLAPNCRLSGSQYLHHLINSNQFALLIFHDDKLLPSKTKLQNFISEFQSIMNSVIVTRGTTDWELNTIEDVTGNIKKSYSAKPGSDYLIRPDKYIALCNDVLRLEEVRSYLNCLKQ